MQRLVLKHGRNKQREILGLRCTYEPPTTARPRNCSFVPRFPGGGRSHMEPSPRILSFSCAAGVGRRRRCPHKSIPAVLPFQQHYVNQDVRKQRRNAARQAGSSFRAVQYGVQQLT